MPPRTCCLDLDTFFVSVERLYDPSLVGKAVVVGGAKGGRGVVTSASYEVRAFGVHSGMSLKDATRLAPDAVFVPGRGEVYGEWSARVKAVLERFSPSVSPASIDEFYLDFSGCERLFARPGDATGDATIARTAREMCAAILRETGLPASAGLGVTRVVAKIASGRAKPAGVWLVREGEERAFVAPLSVRKFPGIGPVGEARLGKAGILTLGQLLALSPQDARVGGFVEAVLEGLDPCRARPRAERPAFQEHDLSIDGSLSNERTFFEALSDPLAVSTAMGALVQRVAWRLRRRGGRASTVSLKLRYSDFTTLSRTETIPPTAEEAELLAVTMRLLARAWTRPAGVRLLGVCLSNLLGADPQVPLFRPPRPRASVAIDAVRGRFGYEAIRLGGS